MEEQALMLDKKFNLTGHHESDIMVAETLPDSFFLGW